MIRGLAQSHGFTDPLTIMANLRKFAEPSEVSEPIELLRAGLVMHARGLINTRAIQNNLDWIWPYWIERQFDPLDPSFVPRAFSLTHINLTHRNWTGVGVANCESIPIIDPRGLITPHFDGWSLDIWLIPEDRKFDLLPSRAENLEQRMECDTKLIVSSSIRGQNSLLSSEVSVENLAESVDCKISIRGFSNQKFRLVVSVRPYNPEGISFVHKLANMPGSDGIAINDSDCVKFNSKPSQLLFSTYKQGDVYQLLDSSDQGSESSVTCDVGLASAAAVFDCESEQERKIEVRVPLIKQEEAKKQYLSSQAFEESPCRLELPDTKVRDLFFCSKRVLQLLSPGPDVYAGPFSYKRFWFRDATYILYTLSVLGFHDRVSKIISGFEKRQLSSGYFLSQEGEWDSNGEVLWLLGQRQAMTGVQLNEAQRRMVIKAAQWIERKRLSKIKPDSPHYSILPAGFSAEHLGPNDYYYWDNFWSVAGLRATACLLGEVQGRVWDVKAKDYMQAVELSISRSIGFRSRGAVAASPYRRMDAGAIGSIVASYPLRLMQPDDQRIRKTVDFLLERCLVKGAFFQDMIHSGMNAYLTLHIAQCLLRQGDLRSINLMRAVMDLASPTGQWPEAIHPNTLGGCMGDGQHAWACAEWIMMVRNSFVREEDNNIIIGSGLWPEWLSAGQEMSFGPSCTEFGTISVSISVGAERSCQVEWRSDWLTQPKFLICSLSGYEKQFVEYPDKQGRLNLKLLN